MAHFAKLDENNVVIAVFPVSNDALDPLNEENTGISFLINWSNGYSNWKQTSYNGNFRKNYAGIGFTYDAHRDAFIPPKPFDSWVLDENTCNWFPPIPKPEVGNYEWDEYLGEWIEA